MVRWSGRAHQIRVFIYLFGEIVPQFISTVVIFSSVLIISQLIRLTELLVAIGLSFENIVLPIVFVAVPFKPHHTHGVYVCGDACLLQDVGRWGGGRPVGGGIFPA